MVNWLIDLHVVLTHILPEASSIALTSASIEIGTSTEYAGRHPAAMNEFKQSFVREITRRSAKNPPKYFWSAREFQQESCHLKLSTAPKLLNSCNILGVVNHLGDTRLLRRYDLDKYIHKQF